MKKAGMSYSACKLGAMGKDKRAGNDKREYLHKEY
jgi:hypothetical protein